MLGLLDLLSRRPLPLTFFFGLCHSWLLDELALLEAPESSPELVSSGADEALEPWLLDLERMLFEPYSPAGEAGGEPLLLLRGGDSGARLGGVRGGEREGSSASACSLRFSLRFRAAFKLAICLAEAVYAVGGGVHFARRAG